MRAKVLTLRFSPQLGRFDDAPLIALQQKVVLEHVREHLIHVGDEVMLVCVATWREREPATQAPTTTHSAETSTATESPPEPSRAPATPVADLLEDLTPQQQAMFELVRAWRRQKAQAEGALVHKAKVGKTVARRTRIHIRTAYDAGIPSSVIRLRMLHASRASTDCPSASRACSRSPRILL
ncbi:MAG: hypothetical protein ACI91B_004357 [Planctomycetota bacterium]|jgi:hypothetical protein